MGRVITATGVTPDIVLANFFIVYFSVSVKNSLAVLAYSNNLTVGNSRGARPLFKKYLGVEYKEISLSSPLKERNTEVKENNINGELKRGEAPLRKCFPFSVEGGYTIKGV